MDDVKSEEPVQETRPAEEEGNEEVGHYKIR
jgi:hypothetical protein